jgi:penicillin amidase
MINNVSRTSGPSWRMVVSLGPEVEAWAVYPGGESGNPGSRYYDNLLAAWVAGTAYPVVFLRSPDQAHQRLVGQTELGGGR